MTAPSAPHAYRPGIRDTVMHALARAVERNPDGEFLAIDGVGITYRQIDHDANAMARKFQELGVGKGDTVVTLFDTSLDVFVCWFAINKLGAIWVPINTAYRGEFLRHQVSDTGARLAICDPQYLERFEHIADLLPNLQLILCRSPGPFPICTIPIHSLDEYRGTDGSTLPIIVQPSDMATLIYTSGTTGPSKGCMISHNFMCMQGRQHRRHVPQEPGETGWTCLPVFHSAALIFVLGALVEGLRVAVASKFSVTRFWDEIETAGASNTLLMASIFPLVAHAPDCEAAQRYHGKLKMVFGVPISAPVRQIWKNRFGVKVVSSWSYGQTEGVRLTSAYPDETPPEESAGRPTDEYEIMIVDADDQPVPEGTVGEIVYRPREPNVMFEGYWRRPEDTAKVWRNMWMHSGDLGKMIGGYLYFCDRAKDYLRSRGENISSFEVERTFMGHHAVAEAAVHAVGAQNGEDSIKVTAVLREGAVLNEKELCLWSIENLPYFAVPRYFEFRHELPKNPTGRVLKYQLRDDGVTASTWDRDAAGIAVRRSN
ncbi:AMP-binding protein [Niveispirillum sp. SYP-B3756]|uniref:AMP-binding protein n=1 Tax=Niveispirillum sp. SYP-B3756 TaxID=2662178 RepID=UPI001292B737|nr:AMP-binding protein [Niveispirillum sp. SYP-B3756]MQP68304.1 AMP-binding protein [Niveispirillum sp. SYP-B3756]